MQGIENWIGSIIFFLIFVVALPLAALFMPIRRERQALPAEKETDAHPALYCTAGFVLTVLAGAVGGIVAWGFLLPGLGWIEMNRLSDLAIWIPLGRQSHGKSARLSVSDTEMSFLISAIAASMVAIGLFLIVRGIRRLPRKSV